MAEQIPYGIADNLLMKLGSAVFHEIGLVYGVRGELRKLEDTLSTVRAVLLDAEEKQESSHAVAVWVRRLKDVVYDADDLFDDFATEDLSRKTVVHRRFGIGQVSDFFSSSNHLAFRFKMGHRIKAIREKLDHIANDISKFNLIPRVVIYDVSVRKRVRETCSIVDKSHKIVGRDENKREIIGLLMQQENLSTVVVVGMGGLGKTTLAQLVYNDQGVVSYFSLHMWVCVSDEFDAGALVQNVLRSATNEDVGNLNLPLEQLQKRLQEELDGKRYLLVLDDVWNEDVKKWGQFITLLPVGANGSKILATTRSTKVASVMGVDSPYIMEGLKDDESWELFESLAFRKGEEKMHPNLVAIGKEIVKMCKGVPLVIETIGRILYFKTQESQWLNIKNNKSLMLLGDENDILSSLRISYDNLPTHLKQCFAYCALFPKDYKIEKKLLVQLWMAQGYLQVSSDENMNLEDVGNQYFDDLLSRSLFHKVENEDGNDVLSCKMHDLIHDLAQSIVKSEVIIVTNDVKIVPERTHHVSLFNKPNEMPKVLMSKSIRTFFMDSYYSNNYIRNRFISNFKCSRVMKVNFLLHKVPTSLIKLGHLRYLDLSHGSFENLPGGITRLKHLQTLKLLFCSNFKEWPRNMKKLINLRHLEIDGNNELTYMPSGLGELIKLQTLPIFLLGNDSGDSRHKRKRMGRLSELKFLNNLRGQLVIEGLSNARGGDDKEAHLETKQYLECLVLSYRLLKESTQESEEMVSVMESLQPHSNLKELFMHDYGGARFPNWMMNDRLDLRLPNLVMVHICFCRRSQVLPPFGQLPFLKCLRLFYLYGVKYMKDNPSSPKPFFPSLKTLVIDDLPNLEGWGRRCWRMIQSWFFNSFY